MSAPAGPPRALVDAHVHLFPPRVFAAIWRWFDRHAWPVRYRLPAQEVITFLEGRGVERLFALHYSHVPGMARALNRYVTELARLSPAVVPFGTVLPGEPEAEAIVAESLDVLGHAGLKLHCHVQKVAPDDERLFPIYEAVARRGKVLVLHAGREPASEAYGFDSRRLCGAEPVARVVQRYPELKLVVPHLGQDQWREFLALCRSAPNLYLDTTMAVGGYLTADVPGRQEILDASDRLLFGTDFPNIPYAWERERDWLLGLGLPEPALEGILRGNALRLAGLG
ncbi:MAG TPA: amidohydrolase family protein [Vicinamibacteria bacterium]|nr:amidohydrolase family protein [Vicinamibacteria bacterium]